MHQPQITRRRAKQPPPLSRAILPRTTKHLPLPTPMLSRHTPKIKQRTSKIPRHTPRSIIVHPRERKLRANIALLGHVPQVLEDIVDALRRVGVYAAAFVGVGARGGVGGSLAVGAALVVGEADCVAGEVAATGGAGAEVGYCYGQRGKGGGRGGYICRRRIYSSGLSLRRNVGCRCP
jgi:hypothetical protein